MIGVVNQTNLWCRNLLWIPTSKINYFNFSTQGVLEANLSIRSIISLQILVCLVFLSFLSFNPIWICTFYGTERVMVLCFYCYIFLMLVLAAALISLLISIKIDGHLWITNSNNRSKLSEVEVEFESNLISFIFWSEFCSHSSRIRCSSAFSNRNVRKLQTVPYTFQHFWRKN